MNIRTVLSTIASLCVCTLLVHTACGGEIPLGKVRGGEVCIVSPVREYVSSVYSTQPSLMSFEDKDREYEESQLRRFEIVFFISLPASLLFSFAGASAFKAASEGEIRFSSLDYGYILLSSIGISCTIGLHDNRVVYRKGKIHQGRSK